VKIESRLAIASGLPKDQLQFEGSLVKKQCKPIDVGAGEQ
jgi:hypothetical protein